MSPSSLSAGRYGAAAVASLFFIQNAASFTTVPLKTTPQVSKTNLFASSSIATQEQKDEEKQIVRLIDPRSNREVILVGCMHYNPASIQLAEKTAVDAVNSLSSLEEPSSSSSSPFPSFFNFMKKEQEEGGLAAVLVESCRTRWDAANKFRSETLKEPWQQEIYDKLLPNEMRAAANIANAQGIPVVLGDQAIETTGDRVKATLKQTLKDLVTPLDGGWDRIGKDVSVGFGVISNSFGVGGASDDDDDDEKSKVQPTAGRLTYKDFLDTNLLFGMPTSLARYPLGILVRFPKFGLALLSIFSAIDYASGQLMVDSLSSSDPLVQTLVTSFVGSSSAIVDDASPLSWSFSFLVAALETIVFARVFMLPILAERDYVLARSIVATCAATGGTRVNSEAVDLYRDILEEKDSDGKQSSSNGAVVAVLGAAHVNGVRDIILNGDENDPLLRL